jgi:ABC-2 type transport system permease protein
MKHFFSVYRSLLKANLAVSLMYRANFIQDALGSLLWSAFSFASVLLVTARLPDVAGFSRADLLVLASNYGIVVGTHHFLFTGAFRRLTGILAHGELDGYLLKPFDNLALLTIGSIRYSHIFRILGSIAVTAWLAYHYSLPVSLSGIGAFAWLTAMSVLLIYSLYCLVVIPLIWYPQLDNLLELLNNSIGSGRYPSATLPYMPRILSLYFLPFLLLVNFPTQALFGRLGPGAFIVYSAACLGTLLLTRFAWKRALRYWSGAGG